jgi:hypothetical protein
MNWREAFEAHIDCLSLLDFLIKGTVRANMKSASNMSLDKSWQIDHNILSRATVFAWSKDTIQACMVAARSIPEDTPIRIELPEDNAYQLWYFGEHPLPYPPAVTSNEPVVGLLVYGDKRAPRLGLHTYVRVDHPTRKFRMGPSQMAVIDTEVDFNTFAERSRKAHDEIYLHGVHRNFHLTDEERIQSREHFVRTTIEQVKFIMAGLVWMSQKIVHVDDENAERHRRKEFERKTDRKPSAVKVVRLRKMLATEKPVDPLEQPGKREFTCQWVVEGHWRNQAYGPKHGERRLQFIMPYVKGPEDKPLRTHEKKIVVVDR